MHNIKINSQILNITGAIFEKVKMQEGLCNEVFFLRAEKGKFILKIAKDKARKLELDKEYNIINNLKNLVDLPRIYLYQKNEKNSLFIMEFVEGEKPTLFSDNILKKMATTLKKVHQIHSTKNQVNFNNLIKLAEQNMNENKLDLDEFVKDGKTYEPADILQYLKDNQPIANECLVHGDYRPKNLLLQNDKIYVLDWGLSFVGDPYYDLAIIKWYFSEDEFNKFIQFYGIKKLDKNRLEYNEWLSAFLNV